MFNDFFFSLLTGLINELRRRPRLRVWLLWLSPLAAALFGFLQLVVMQQGHGEYVSDFNRFAEKVLTPLIFGSLFVFFLAIASYSKIDLASKRLEAELDSLQSEREQLRAKLAQEEKQPHSGPADVLDTIRLNLNQLTEYYTINKGQAKSSFRASMFAMFVGLVMICSGIWLLYSGSPGGSALRRW